MRYENTNLTYKAMTSPNLEFLAVEDFYFSPTAKLADLVLPSSDWAERCTYNEEIDGNMILTFDQAVEAPGECWDDWRFFLEWGKRIDPEHWWWKDEKDMALWRLKEFYGYDLTWNEFQSTNVRSTEPGSENREIKKGVVAVPRPGWRDECPELGLPGYGRNKANGNILVPSTPAESGYGATPMRSSLCKIEMGRSDL